MKRKMGMKVQCHRHMMQAEWDWGETRSKEKGEKDKLEHWLKDLDPWCSHKTPFSVQNSNFQARKWIGSKLALGFTWQPLNSALGNKREAGDKGSISEHNFPQLLFPLSRSLGVSSSSFTLQSYLTQVLPKIRPSSPNCPPLPGCLLISDWSPRQPRLQTTASY